MAIDSRLFGTRTSTGNEVSIKATEDGVLQVAQGLPSGAVLTAKGNGWQIMSTVAAAALVVRPSTVANVTLYNGNSKDSLIIERAFAHWLVSTAAQTFAGIWLCSHPVGMTVPGADIDSTVAASTVGKSNYPGIIQFAIDETVGDDGWFPWGNQVETSATGVLPGASIIAPVEGRIIVPPTGGVSLQVVSGLVGDTFTAGFHFYSEELILA